MIRKLFCRECGEKWNLFPEDRHQGWKYRKVFLSVAGPPPGHGIRTNGKFEPLVALACDSCSAVINNSIVIALTTWRGSDEDRPRNWEEEYGQVLPVEAVEVVDKLTNKTNEHDSRDR